MKNLLFAGLLCACGLFADNSGNNSDGVRSCDLRTIKGSYGLTGTGVTRATGQPEPFALMGRVDFSGTGVFSGNQTETVGTLVLRLPLAGTYVVRPDCSGTLSVPIPGGTATFDILILRGADEILLIQTVPGEIAAGTLKKM